MVQLKGKAELAKSEEPKGGFSYIITAVTEEKTAVQHFNGLRVTLEPTSTKEKARLKEEEKDVASMLWIADAVSGEPFFLDFADDSGISTHGSHSHRLNPSLWYRDYAAQKREVAGVKSKLGSFLDAFTQFLGDEDLALDTDNWLKHEVRIVSWKEKAREVAIIK